jgi:hypothetical protein
MSPATSDRIHSARSEDLSSSLSPELIAGALYTPIPNSIDSYKHSQRLWIHALYKERSGSALLLDLESWIISGHYKIFTCLNPTNFEYLVNLVGSRIYKCYAKFLQISVKCRHLSTSHFVLLCDATPGSQETYTLMNKRVGCLRAYSKPLCVCRNNRQFVVPW